MSRDVQGSGGLDELGRRLGRLEDIEAIKNLKAQYARYCDAGYDADLLASLFTEDAVWESNLFGPYVGRESIRSYFRGLGAGGILWAHHCIVSPLLEVNEAGDSAHGSWYLLDLATFRSDDAGDAEPVVVTATYEDWAVKLDGEWRFSRVKAHFHQVSSLLVGWVRERYRDAPGSS